MISDHFGLGRAFRSGFTWGNYVIAHGIRRAAPSGGRDIEYTITGELMEVAGVLIAITGVPTAITAH